jgi:hypothetical protein
LRQVQPRINLADREIHLARKACGLCAQEPFNGLPNRCMILACGCVCNCRIGNDEQKRGK